MTRYRVTVMNEKTLGTWSTSRFRKTKLEAMDLAKRLAGDESEFFRQGDAYGYVGSAGKAYVAELEVSEREDAR